MAVSDSGSEWWVEREVVMGDSRVGGWAIMYDRLPPGIDTSA
jgi:hypothetical protein